MQHDRTASGQRGDTPDNKPDQVVAEHSRRAEEHIDEHIDEQRGELAADGDGEAAPSDDAMHGYSQDAGYAQSAGNPEPAASAGSKRQAQTDRKDRARH